tara:strand:+ start:1267 stop:1608 length:342 start_codon:yes stop_codon:yes gene_type:complete
MATHAYRETLPTNEQLTEATVFESKAAHRKGYSKMSLALHSASTNTRITVYYIFEETNAENTKAQIKEIDLAQNVLTLYNLDMPTGIIRVTRNNVDSSACSGGALKIDANFTK